MPIALACPCGHSMKLRDDLAGKPVKCQNCSRDLVVPVAASANADYEVIAESPAKDQPAAAPFDWDDAPKAKKKKKKKKKQDVKGFTKEDYEEWDEKSANRAFAIKRTAYISIGGLAVVGSIIAAAIFVLNGMGGLIPLGACALGVLAGGYCVFQGFTGTFHER